MPSPKQHKSRHHHNLKRIINFHFWFAGIYALQIVVFDAWNLITPEAIIQRWIAISAFLILLLMVWSAARRLASNQSDSLLVWSLITADVMLASFNIYVQRGMASRAVILYVLPILVAAVLKSGAAIFGAAVLSAVAYFITAQAYFILNFNEGYKIELYGEIGFYCLFLLMMATLLAWVTRARRD